jgi:uncharacterized membrane protein HdeD (DUF308 family)
MVQRPEDVVQEAGRGWWVYLVTGGIWLVFGWVVLSVRSEITTVWGVVVYAGILFFMFGFGELAAAFVAPGYRWLHAIFAAVGIIAGIGAFVWPGQTFVTLAAFIGWFLLFDGTFQLIGGLMRRHEVDLWWLFLIIGVLEVLVAFWAIGYPGRSITLLVVWVGASALAKGMAQIFGAFALHHAERALAGR